MKYSTYEFIEWDSEAQAEIAGIVAKLRVWKNGDSAVSLMQLANFDVWSSSSDDILPILQQWVIKAKKHCTAIMESATLAMQPINLGYTGLIFVVVWNYKQIDITPMLEKSIQGTYSRASLANATLIRPEQQKVSLFATSEQGWQDWLDEQASILKTPIDKLVAAGEFEQLDDETFFETRGEIGRTNYKKT